MDQAEWKCVATNDFGHSVTSCFLKLLIPKHFKKPRFLECLKAVLSEEGAVNLECKVIGVPQPVLKWYKDGKELKPGDIHRITSGEVSDALLCFYLKIVNPISGWNLLFGHLYMRSQKLYGNCGKFGFIAWLRGSSKTQTKFTHRVSKTIISFYHSRGKNVTTVRYAARRYVANYRR